MGAKGFIALGAATIALLAGPGVAWAQEDGTVGGAAPVQAGPAVAPETDPVTTTESDDPSTDAQTASDTGTSTVAEDTSSGAAAEPAAAETTGEASPADVSTDQPQAEVETTSRSVTEVKKANTGSNSCGLARTAAAGGNGVGPPGPGCTRVDGPQISKDPANPTVLPAINGVTVAIWVEDTPSGPVVHWQIQSGTFNGTDAIDLLVKGGPDPNGFTCQISNATPTGVCHAPVNPNNGKYYGVSHVDACPGNTTTPPTNTPPGGGGTGGVAGQTQKGGENNQQGVKGQSGGGSTTSPTVSVSSAALGAAPGEELPFTGLAALWLLVIGAGLLGGGAVMRTRLS